MRNISSTLGAIGCMGVFFTATMLGCGGAEGGSGGSNSAICDVEFSDLAGKYSFSMTTGRTDYTNSCFENYDDPNPPDPATLTNCTWETSEVKETITVELTITDDGNIGSANVTNIIDENGQPEAVELGVKCEMLKGELCNAPIRCTFSGDKCSPPDFTDPEMWKYSCNCGAGTPHDETSQACLDCKAEYDQYQAESTSYCQKQKDSQYLELTLTVN
jgi:hypothetical protein